ncbi:FIST C-terminal domain-containing protein [Actinoplanes sp. LDG1-06]|uniref:FIST C-terminal domain-containing protein n=1 Tax=Paractinoplanes ovalisporus TaxID=2810368 RepID=A0ABS2ABE6_9ACTN|nr:FIST N-terminal domain-containing protein [Actinoplanes ovalisporus]MBM2617147.1 FIST C-terminal domain-containing protein [Actinoplanes ovalisporus]
MQTNPHRWFGVGQSSAADSRKAGAEAAAEAIGGREAKAVFVFASVSHDLAELLRGVRMEAGADAEIVGATTMGEMGSAGVTSGGISVAALGGDGFTVQTRAARIDRAHPREAGAAVAEALHDMDDEHKVLIMFADGLTGQPHEIVRGAYSSIGASVPLVGGFAADDRNFKATYQFYGDEAHTGAVVGLALGSDGPIGIGVAHGWRRIEPPMIVTKATGPHIYELDGEPALDVLLRRNNFDGSAEEFFDRGRSLQPLGLSRRSGEDIRVIHSGDDEARTVWGTADVPQGALVWLMEGDRQSLLDGAAWSCTEAVARLEGLPPLGVLAFDCGGRRAGLIEGGLEQEIQAMRTALSDAPFAGFYTFGEIARVRGALGTHHLTLVTLALA